MRSFFAGLAVALVTAAAHAEARPEVLSCKLIKTAAELQAINPSGSYCLANDIDLRTIPNWTPIGGIGGFDGQFYGNGHVIRNLRIRASATGNYGLFSIVGGQVQDVGLVNAKVIVTGLPALGIATAGALAGFVGPAGTPALVSNVHSTGHIVCTGASAAPCYAGGLVGYVRDATVIDGWSSADVISSYVAGGLSGISDTPATHRRVHATGAVTVIAGGVAAGGLAGQLTGSGKNFVKEAYATGPVRGAAGTNLGGLIGAVTGAAAVVRDAYATGPVTGAEPVTVGGLIGSTGNSNSVSQVFAAGKITPNDSSGGSVTGGVIGAVSGGGLATGNCYWDLETTGLSVSAGSGDEGKTTAQLRAPPPGFFGAWGINKGLSYPYLNDPNNFTSNLATLVRSHRVFTFLPIQQSDKSQYLGRPLHTNAASLATVYTMIARAIGITDNVASLLNIKIDKTYWNDATREARFAGPVRVHATLGPLRSIPAATGLTLFNVIGEMKLQRLVILRGTYKTPNGATATHYMLGTLYQRDGNTVISVIANDPWTGRQVEISPTTKKVITPGFPLTTFRVNGYRSVTVN